MSRPTHELVSILMVCDEDSPVIFDNYMWGVRIIRFTGEKAAEEGFVIYNATTSYELPLFSYFGLFDNELRVEAIMLSPGIYTVYLVDAGGDGWPANSGVMMIKGRNDIIGYTLPSGYGAYDEIYIPYFCLLQKCTKRDSNPRVRTHYGLNVTPWTTRASVLWTFP